MRLIHRMKILMAIIQEFGGRLPTADLHAYLFLFCHECVEHNHYYDFIPQTNGPHSLQAEADKATLINKKCLEKTTDWVVKTGVERFATSLDFFEKMGVQDLKNTWHNKPSDVLHRYLKEQHGNYFTTNAIVNDAQDDTRFFTIGYEGLSPEAYLNKLVANNVKLLCDVRKNAYSQKYGFSKSELKDALNKVTIEYRHIPELGIVSEKRQSLDTDQDYKKLFDEYEQETLTNQGDSLNLLVSLLQEHGRIAITCFEADVYHCHRSRIAKTLSKRDNFPCKVEHL